MKRIIIIISIFTLLLSLVGCRDNAPPSGANYDTSDECQVTVPAINLTQSFTASDADKTNTDNGSSWYQMNFSVDLFKACAAQTDENLLISPASVYSVLGMAANGAAGETLEQFKDVIYGGNELPNCNKYMRAFLSRQTKLKTANSLWVDDSIGVYDTFLQDCVDYYGAEVFSVSFGDEAKNTVNGWINNKTNGMVKELGCDFSDNDALVLLNTALFDANWYYEYYDHQTGSGIFHSAGGEERTVQMMRKLESGYIWDECAQGFVKELESTEYAFAALLPNEGVDIKDYIASLDANSLFETLSGVEEYTFLISVISKFAYSCEINMSEVLQDMNLTLPFSEKSADFSNISDGELFMREIDHKTVIYVNEVGVKCAAVTPALTAVRGDSVEKLVITLDRPFVYIIYEKDTSLPIFMGAVMDIE